ncbi:MAG TPA: MDR family MFS transporter [Chloroflexia bacterium]|nr:MDR family MFS transporter [Chloroflexia bacterium]
MTVVEERVETAPPVMRHPQSHKGLVIGAVMLTTALSALDANIVGTAIPSIVGALRGISLLPWLVTAFLLTSTVTVPLYGKLSDLYGRKPVLLIGIAIFLIGSVLCGVAGSMEQLIAFRALQGLGAGSVVPVTLTLIGDLFDLDERARLQGLFSAVWGVSSVLGPLAGGFIVQVWSWPWIFLINLPVGLVAMAVLGIYLREPDRASRTRPRLDIAGALTLMGGVTAGLLALSLASNGDPAGVVPAYGLLAACVVLLAAFFVIERRAAEPLMPIDLLTLPINRVSVISGVLSAGLLFGGGSYLAILAQGVWQMSPLEAGLALAPLSIGWPLASTFCGRLIRRWGYRSVALTGAVLVAVGAVPLAWLGQDGPIWLLPVTMFVQGVGFGLNFSTILMAVQNAVGWERRGAATSLYQFSRNIGGTLAGAALGFVLTIALTGELARLPGLALPPAGGEAGGRLGAANLLLDLGARASLPPATKQALTGALAGALHPVLIVLAVLGVASLAATWFFPPIPHEDAPGPT